MTTVATIVNPRPNGTRRIFTDAEIREYGRCPECEYHPRTQGHERACPHFVKVN